jgi:hypothetical protein
MRLEMVNGDQVAASEVEKILGSRKNFELGGKREYEVKWKDFNECTWEPAESLGEGEKKSWRSLEE